MKLWAVIPCRNDWWVIGFAIRVALRWCDGVVVLHHCAASDFNNIDPCRANQVSMTHGAIVSACASEEGRGRVGLVNCPDETWNEMQHRQKMLEVARENGATHIALIDADEILTANLVPTMRQQVERLDASILMLPLYNLRGSMTRYHANGTWGRRIVSAAFKDSPELEWRGDRFHHREPMGRVWRPFQPVSQGDGGVLHLWGASERRLHAKHRLYKLTERLRWPDKDVREIEQMYSMYDKGALGDDPRRWTFNSVPESWIEPYRELMEKHLHLDAVPWQEAECERLIAEHGRERFAGLSA